ncbi:MAG: DUF1343 domain-containing protein [Opitutales bacterium]|nr:DUF1343 domain-containing protein [Opitutales bacterium]
MVASTAMFTAKTTPSQVTMAAVSPNTNKVPVIAAKKKALFGIDVLKGEKFSQIRHKNVGLLTNVSGVDNQGNSTAIIFADSKEFTLKAVFFPEHDGMLPSQTLAHLKDKKIPTYCTHSDQTGRRTPEDAWLKGLDVMVIDLQGFGMRYYTYYASALYVMGTCFNNRIPVLVLDRPNPLGNYLGGPSIAGDYVSFLGPISGMPLFYPLTLGEFLNFIHKRGQTINIPCKTCTKPNCLHTVHCDAATLKKGDLKIVECKNYRRCDTFLDLGCYQKNSSLSLSPNIPNVASIFEYAITSLSTLVNQDTLGCLYFLTNPQDPKQSFKYIYSPYRDANSLLSAIKRYPDALKGCRLDIVTINDKGVSKNCIRVEVTDFKSTVPALLSLVLLSEMQEIVPDRDWDDFLKKQELRTPKNIDVIATAKAHDLKKLPLIYQKELRKAKWDRLSDDPKVQQQKKMLFCKHAGDAEFVAKIFNGESIDIDYFRKKWARESEAFLKELQKYEIKAYH